MNGGIYIYAQYIKWLVIKILSSFFFKNELILLLIDRNASFYK